MPPDYPFDRIRGMSGSAAVTTMRGLHNRELRQHVEPVFHRQWRSGVCATGSSKSASCDGRIVHRLRVEHLSAGSFPDCRSPLGVYDIDGNAAEHMNLPLSEDQMASRGSTTLGVTR